MKELQKIHDKLIKYFKSLEDSHTVKHTIETPNKYGDNVSYFTVVYDFEDMFNHSTYDVNVNYSRGTVFVRYKGYFNFKSFNDIKKIVAKTYKKK